MRTLNISIEINGEQIPVGAITGLDSNDAVFSYDTNYIAEGYQPISISLPLQEEPFTAYEILPRHWEYRQKENMSKKDRIT